MNQKVIKLDLSTFFDDERKFCYVLVDSNWKSVACLQKRIQLLFDLDCVRLLSDGCFLPPQESIEIVKLCTDIKAFVPKDALELRKKKKSQKHKNMENSSEDSANAEIAFAELDQEQVNDSQKKRKYNSLEKSHSFSNFSNKAKRSKNNNKNAILNSGVLDKEVERLSDFKEYITENESARLKSKIKGKSSKENIVDSTASDGEHKKRQTSMPTEMKKLEMTENFGDKTLPNDEMKTIAVRHSSISSILLSESKMLENSDNSPNAKNPFKKPNSCRAHVYFSETGEILSSTAKIESKSTQKNIKEPKTIVIFHCPLSDVTNSTQPQKPRIFHLKCINRSMANNTAKKEIVQIQEQIVLPPVSIQNIANKLSIANKEIESSEVVKQKEANETIKEADMADSLNEKSALSNITVASVATANGKNEEKEKLRTNGLEYTNVVETYNKSQMKQPKVDETSIMSVDCVDLSNDLDEDDIEVREKKTTEVQQQKNDLTANDEGSKSSASDIEEISEIIDLNETEDNSNTMINNSTKHKSLKDILVDNILPYSTDLKVLPDIEDIIVFKVPYLKNKKFVNTNFIAGKVEYINKRTNRIKILIIDDNSELCYIPNQFVCNLDESQEYPKYLQLKLNDMRELKLFSSS